MRADRRGQRLRRAAPAGLPPGRARPGPGLRHRRDRRRGRPARRLPPGVAGGPRERRLPEAEPGHRPRRAAHGQGARRVRPAARAAGVPGPAPRPAALADPRPGRDLAPLRPLQRLLRADPRPAHGLLLRLLHAGPRRPDVHRRGRPARQARPGLPQARPARGGAGPPAPRHRLRLGLAVALRRRDVRRAGRRRDHRQGAEGVHRRADRRAGPGQDKVEIRLQDYRDVPDGPYDTISSIEMGEHVGQKNYPVYTGGIHGLLKRRRPRADPADVAHHPPRRRPVHRGVHRPRHAHAAGRRDGRPDRAVRPRGPRRARAARALRVDRRRVVPPRSRTTGTRSSRWSARRSPACGGSTSSAARSRSRRAGWASTRS